MLSLYIPNKDKDGGAIQNQEQWIEEAIRLFCEINGGASAMPPIDGGWLNDEGVIVREKPVVVYSYIRPGRFIAELPRIREFLHRLGKLTNQGEIGIEFGEMFYRIRNFD